MAPLRALLAAIGGARLAHERRQHRGRGVVADEGERLERLVGEVERVALVDEDVVGGGGEHHGVDVGGRRAGDGRGQHPLGRIGRARLDEPAVPLGQPLGRQLRGGEGRLGEAGRVATGVAAHEGEGVHEGERPVGRVEVGQHVGHRHQHGEAAPPALRPVAHAVFEAGGHDGGAARIGLEQPERGLGGDEREAVLQPVGQAPAQLPDRVGRRAASHPHVVAVHLDVEGDGVVGPRVEGAARRQVEAGVVPVAGEQAGLDGALVEGEAEVRAAVLDGPRPALVPDHHHRDRAELREKAPVALQLDGGAGVDALVVDASRRRVSAPARRFGQARSSQNRSMLGRRWRTSSRTRSDASSSGSSGSSRPPRPSSRRASA